MGGTASPEYQKFREHCYNALLTLRRLVEASSALRLGCFIPFLSGHDRSANLILNLFSLMLNAGVPDIALEPDKTVQKVLVHIHTIPAAASS